MTRRPFVVGVLLVLMAGFGLGVYHVLGTFKTDTTQAADSPTRSKPSLSLPGTIYFSQQGTLYRLAGDRFTAITDNSGWMQPTPLRDGTLLAVRRDSNFSDLYHLDAGGKVIEQLTNDRGKSIDQNHWVFFPHASSDGTSVFYSYDEPKGGFRVDLAVWSQPLDATAPTPRSGNSPRARRWTDPSQYTGGDIQPIPLANGGLIYVGYAVDAKEHINATVYVQAGPFKQSKPLTTSDEDCSAPALSPDGRTLALVCTHGTQVASLEVASFDGTSLGPLRAVVSDALAAAPTWAPDGSGLIYLAPAATGGHFQLWWLAGAAGEVLPPTPPATPTPHGATPRATAAASPSPTSSVAGLATPQQVTSNLDFDATSAPAWTAG